MKVDQTQSVCVTRVLNGHVCPQQESGNGSHVVICHVNVWICWRVPSFVYQPLHVTRGKRLACILFSLSINPVLVLTSVRWRNCAPLTSSSSENNCWLISIKDLSSSASSASRLSSLCPYRLRGRAKVSRHTQSTFRCSNLPFDRLQVIFLLPSRKYTISLLQPDLHFAQLP